MSDVTLPNTRPVLTTRFQLANRLRHLLFRDMAQAGLEREIEFAVPERHIGDRPELAKFLQRLRCPRVDRAVVLDAPGIDAARPQRTHQPAAGGARHQQLVSPRPGSRRS